MIPCSDKLLLTARQWEKHSFQNNNTLTAAGLAFAASCFIEKLLSEEEEEESKES
jgi:hypothetical protein